MTINAKFTKYITLILFIFLTAGMYATSKKSLPYLVLDNISTQLFTPPVLNQQKIRKTLCKGVLVEEKLVSSLDNRYLAYKISCKYLSKKQRKKFVDTIRYYLIKIYDFLLKQKNWLAALE